MSTKFLRSAFVLLILASGAASATTIDVTSVKGITIGGAVGGAGGKLVAWGGTVELNPADAIARGNGRCAFNVSYDMVNNGTGAATNFRNVLMAHDAKVAVNSLLSLDAGQTKQVNAQPYLMPGTYALSLVLDSEHQLTESNEDNNKRSVTVTLKEPCTKDVPAPKADLVSQKGLGMGGDRNGKGSHAVPWGGAITVHAADAALTANGKCAFNIMYEMANVGTADAGPFVNQLLVGTTVVSQQTNLTLAAKHLSMVKTQAYLAPGSNALKLVLDANKNVAESDETNNEAAITVKVDANCKAMPSTSNRK